MIPNFETMPKVKIKRERCKGCQLCLIYCPKGLIKKDESLNKKGIQPLVFQDGAAAEGRDVDSLGKTLLLEVSGGSTPVGKCSGCKFCAIICPDGAVEVYK